MKKRYIFIISLMSLTIILIGSSFAYLKSVEESSINATINLSNVNVALVNDISAITLNNAVPVTDLEGLQSSSITFRIQNQGGVDASYRVSLIDGPKENGKVYMDNSIIKYQLKRTKGSNAEENFGIKLLSDTGLIDEGTITAGSNNQGEIIDYDLKLWIDYDANPNGQVFSKKLLVEGLQVSNLDTSGANYPELTDNMIPVYYDSTNSVWKKADSKNLNSTYKWFDYNQGMWANAVTVKESGTQTRDYYLSADNGTTINMSDVTSMWVWIPRYKYVIFNGNNETADEQMIDVIFEHGLDATGTVSCTTNNLGVESCSDSTYTTLTNKKSTYTHPAFTFGSEKLTGFWMAKYEMSTDDNDCNTTPNETNCNKTNLNILIKPNVTSLKNINISNMFANIRKMEINNNIHGFKQNENATTGLNSSNNLTGEIANDNNIIDSHMIKNMEWGAVAYLSGSKYGKYKNTEGSEVSTTGNLFGVYDMYDGAAEYTMGNMLNSSGQFQVSNAGTWTSNIVPNSKYYDNYSYADSSSGQNSIIKGKLGDATKEVVKDFTSSTGKWYSDYNYASGASNIWSLRGGFEGDTTSNGLFNVLNNSSGEVSTYTSRPVLTVSREIPWLNNNNNS